MAAIELRGVVKAFGQIRAVDGLDLEVPEGICLGLLGEYIGRIYAASQNRPQFLVAMDTEDEDTRLIVDGVESVELAGRR